MWDRIQGNDSYFSFLFHGVFTLIPTIAWSFHLVFCLVISSFLPLFLICSHLPFFFFFFLTCTLSFSSSLSPSLPLSVCVLLCGRCTLVWTLRSLWVLRTHQPLFVSPFSPSSFSLFFYAEAVWNKCLHADLELSPSFHSHVYWCRK